MPARSGQFHGDTTSGVGAQTDWRWAESRANPSLPTKQQQKSTDTLKPHRPAVPGQALANVLKQPRFFNSGPCSRFAQQEINRETAGNYSIRSASGGRLSTSTGAPDSLRHWIPHCHARRSVHGRRLPGQNQPLTLRPSFVTKQSFAQGRVRPPAARSRGDQGLNDAAYAASEIMSSIESFSTTGFMSALPAPTLTPARKS